MKFIRFEMAGKAEIGILNKEETGILPLSRIYPGFGVTIMQQVIEMIYGRYVRMSLNAQAKTR